ncbi:DUF192 domain-containing protein [Sphingobium chungbukense]|uniref:DUF192 domain-containing protein n=1 Tax=Sphingobium chungbukense TaxID=56193 RepID=A0A0M3AX11_9SPHN|nr:DUF192 domain-containing protein [Sphingobium chungbukense]KKW93134.1 hypothetical protein YP76_05885 [Sphingobium chungbukense]
MTSLSLFILLTACSQSAPKTENTSSPAATRQAALIPLAIRTAKATHRFTVEVALTEQQQEQGLMFRKTLAPDSGMLFPMEPPRTASFWMKNTVIPLDMLFIHTDGSIAFLKSNAAPYSREPVSAGIPVAAVLELAGGRAAELGIQQGDRVSWGNCVLAARADHATNSPKDRLNFCPND